MVSILGGSLGLCRRDGFAQGVGNNLPRGEFSVTQIGEQVFQFRATVFAGNAQQVSLGNLFEAASGLARFALEQSPPDFRGLAALDEIDVVADFAARSGGAHEIQPVAAGNVALLRQDLDHVSIGKAMAQRNDLPVHFRADALVADFGVHGVGEIHGRRAARQRQHFPFRGECVDFLGVQVHLQRGHEFRRLLHLLDPLDQLAHPQNALVVRVGNVLAVLVSPMRGDALLGDAVHFLRTDLHFKRLPGVDHCRMQRLVQVRPRHGDVILEPAGNGPPHLMNHSERGVAVADGVSNHAHGQQIVDLVDGAVLAEAFLVNGIQPLDTAVDFGGDAVFFKLFANRVLQFVQKSFKFLALGDDGFLQFLVSFRLEVTEGEVFEFSADQAHSQAVRDGRIDIERFARNALLFFRPQEIPACACCADGRPASRRRRERR